MENIMHIGQERKWRLEVIEKTSFRTQKIYWDTVEEQVQRLNELLSDLGRIKRIIRIIPAMPDHTTIAKCTEVFYEYYI